MENNKQAGMLDISKCCLVVVDIQGKLAQLMYDRQALFKNIQILIKAAKIMDIPIIWCQQCPEALGPTVPEIAQLLADKEPINKTSFSCCGQEQFNSKLNSLARSQVLLCGIEAHVCIYQTAADLKRHGYYPTVIADAVSSRTKSNQDLALDKMRAMGIDVAATEMLLFELLKTAEHRQFKDVQRLIK